LYESFDKILQCMLTAGKTVSHRVIDSPSRLLDTGKVEPEELRSQVKRLSPAVVISQSMHLVMGPIGEGLMLATLLN